MILLHCSGGDLHTSIQGCRNSCKNVLSKYFTSFILGFVCLKETLQDAAEVIQCPSFKFQLGQWGNSEALTNSAIGNSKAAAIIQRKKIH